MAAEHGSSGSTAVVQTSFAKNAPTPLKTSFWGARREEDLEPITVAWLFDFYNGKKTKDDTTPKKTQKKSHFEVNGEDYQEVNADDLEKNDAVKAENIGHPEKNYAVKTENTGDPRCNYEVKAQKSEDPRDDYPIRTMNTQEPQLNCTTKSQNPSESPDVAHHPRYLNTDGFDYPELYREPRAQDNQENLPPPGLDPVKLGTLRIVKPDGATVLMSYRPDFTGKALLQNIGGKLLLPLGNFRAVFGGKLLIPDLALVSEIGLHGQDALVETYQRLPGGGPPRPSTLTPSRATRLSSPSS